MDSNCDVLTYEEMTNVCAQTGNMELGMYAAAVRDMRGSSGQVGGISEVGGMAERSGGG